jgi:uncharacterized protein (TIGR03000 family)
MSRRWLLLTAAALAVALALPVFSRAEDQPESEAAVPAVTPFVYANPFVWPWLSPFGYVARFPFASGQASAYVSSYPPAPAGNVVPRTTRIYAYTTRPFYGAPGYPFPGSPYVQRQRIDDFDTSAVNTALARQSNYPPPENTSAKSSNTGPAHLDVRVPADAELWVDGKKTTQTGTARTFSTPDLKPGQDYAYEMRADWQDRDRKITQTRRVTFHAGENVKVDFTKPPPAEKRGEELAMPKSK